MPKIKFYSWTYTAVLITQNHQIVFKNEFIVFAFGSQNNVPPGASGGSDSKESACNAGDPDSIPGSGRFPWRIPWTEELGWLQSMGSQRVERD